MRETIVCSALMACAANSIGSLPWYAIAACAPLPLAIISKMSNEQVRLKVLRSGVGAITESDVLLASASNAIIIGFSVRPERKAQELAEQEKVDIRLHSIIYELQDEIKRAMTGLLEPTIKETYQGRAQVLETFRIPKVGTVAGCRVSDGLIKSMTAK